MARILSFQRRFLQIASRRLPTETLMGEIETVTGGNVFKNLDWLLSVNEESVADHFKYLAGTPHPVLNTIRDFLENNTTSFGMVVNLFSVVANAEKSCRVSNKQMTLAKVTEMLRMAALFHKDVVPITEENKQFHKGNKISILCGDFLLAKCLTELATLREQFYVEYMSSALRDLTLGRTLGPMDKNDKIYPSKPTKSNDVSRLDDFSCELSDYRKCLGDPVSEWLLRSSLNGGSLLGKGCSSVLRMANFTEGVQNVGFSFGKYFSLALKANEDIRDILNHGMFDLANLVVYLHIKKHPTLYKEIENHKDDLKMVDYKYIARKLVEDGSLEESFTFRSLLTTAAVDSLAIFKNSQAKSVMVELIKNLEY